MAVVTFAEWTKFASSNGRSERNYYCVLNVVLTDKVPSFYTTTRLLYCCQILITLVIVCTDQGCRKIQNNYNVIMNTLKFEWDEKKASANLKKHGVSFEEARTVFFDEQAKLIDDPDHSDDEERFVLMGLSSSLRVMVVCHCYRDTGNVIRIISARKATTTESKFYK